MSNWEDRIVRFEQGVDPTQLLANPSNPRRHPGGQRNAIRSTLGGVGWVAPVIVNERTGFVIDGHARIEESITAGESVPVIYVDISTKEEAEVLATFDPIGYLATYESETMANLLETIGDSADSQMQALLESLAGVVEIPAASMNYEPITNPNAGAWNPGEFQDGQDALDSTTRSKTIDKVVLDTICPHCFEEFAVDITIDEARLRKSAPSANQ